MFQVPGLCHYPQDSERTPRRCPLAIDKFKSIEILFGFVLYPKPLTLTLSPQQSTVGGRGNHAFFPSL